MFSIYVIQSIKHWKYYIGYSEDIHKRLQYHNLWKVKSTKPYTPYKIIYSEEYKTKTEALKREKELKKMKGNSRFKSIILAGVAQG